MLILIFYFGLTLLFRARSWYRHKQFLKDSRYKEAFEGRELDRWKNNYTTLFFAGNGASFSQASKYCGELGVPERSWGHPRPYAIPSIRTLIKPYPYEPRDPFDVERGFLTYLLHPVYSLCHLYNGIRDHDPYWTDPRKINLAQEDDLNRAVHRIRMALAVDQDRDLILYGCSRGAAVALSALALLDEESQKRIKLVVCEGIFDSVEHVLETRFGPWVRPIVRYLLSFTRYKPDGSSPLKLVPRLPKNVPVVLITSEADRVVSKECTMNLYDALKNQVHEVHCLLLTKSSHSGYSSDDLEDAVGYYQMMLKIYRKTLN